MLTMQHERYHQSNRLDLFEPSNEDTQILNQYAYQYEKSNNAGKPSIL